MIVRNWKKIIYTGIDSELSGNPLALRTVPVAAGVKGMIQMPALITDIDMVTEMTAAAVLDVEHNRLLFAG